MHPTQPESSSKGNATKKKTAITTMLQGWNTALQALRPAVTPDVSTSLLLYGTTFVDGDLADIPQAGLPAGSPAWMCGNADFARRTGTTDAVKRVTITGLLLEATDAAGRLGRSGPNPRTWACRTGSARCCAPSTSTISPGGIAGPSKSESLVPRPSAHDAQVTTTRQPVQSSTFSVSSTGTRVRAPHCGRAHQEEAGVRARRGSAAYLKNRGPV